MAIAKERQACLGLDSLRLSSSLGLLLLGSSGLLGSSSLGLLLLGGSSLLGGGLLLTSGLLL